MIFKETYKMEMNAIEHRKQLDETILQEIDRGGVFMKKKSFRFVPAAVAAVIALVIVVCNFETVAVYATSLFGNFGLTLGGEEIVLDEIEPVNLDYERYQNDEKADRKGANFYYNYRDFNEGLGMELPASDVLEYTTISLSAFAEYNVGHVGASFMYENEPYHMNGRFIISDGACDGLGYGEELKAYDVYEYAEGRKAYFVREEGTEYYQRVYFSTEQYVFQLFVENSDEGAENAKEILEIIGK